VIRFSVLTVESDDPAVMGLVRELLERPGAGVVVVPQATAAASTPAAETKASEPETKPPAGETDATDLRSAAQELGRRGGAKGGHARAAALSSEARSASAKAAADKRWGNEQSQAAAEPPPATPPAQAGTHGTRRVEQAIADLVESDAKASTAVAKPEPPKPAPAAVPTTLELGPRILTAVRAQAGTSVPMLAQMLLGGADQPKLRQIEAALQPLVMRSDVYRANGRVFPSVKSAAAGFGAGDEARAEARGAGRPEGALRQAHRRLCRAQRRARFRACPAAVRRSERPDDQQGQADDQAAVRQRAAQAHGLGQLPSVG
jgi:hypothetical protein